MLAADGAGAFGQSGDDAVDEPQVVEADGRRDDVDDGVDRADLVEMDFVDGLAMRLRLGLRDDPENALRQGPSSLGHVAPVDHRMHVRQIAVLVGVLVVMLVHMAMRVLVLMGVLVVVLGRVLVLMLMLMRMFVVMSVLVVMLVVVRIVVVMVFFGGRS